MKEKTKTLIRKLASLANEETPPLKLDSQKILTGLGIFSSMGGIILLLTSVLIAAGTALSTFKMDGIGKRTKMAIILDNFPVLLLITGLLLIIPGILILKKSGFNFRKFLKPIAICTVTLFLICGVFIYSTKMYKDPSKASPKKVIKELKDGELQQELRDDLWTTINKNMQKLREKAQ